MKEDAPKIVTKKTAKHLRIGKSTLYKAIRGEKIPAVKVESGENREGIT